MAYGDKARERLEDMLREHGITHCDNWNISRGWWLSGQADVMRWQCRAMYQGSLRLIGSWDSITDCIRRGFTVSAGRKAGGYVDVDIQANQ